MTFWCLGPNELSEQLSKFLLELLPIDCDLHLEAVLSLLKEEPGKRLSFTFYSIITIIMYRIIRTVVPSFSILSYTIQQHLIDMRNISNNMLLIVYNRCENFHNNCCSCCKNCFQSWECVVFELFGTSQYLKLFLFQHNSSLSFPLLKCRSYKDWGKYIRRCHSVFGFYLVFEQ
jgi:hypothetical protein